MAFPTLSYTDADGLHAVLLDRDPTSIGRSPGQDVVLRDQYVSREHGTIIRKDNAYSVVDLNSSHGTFLNGVRVQRAALKPGDLLQLGSLKGPRLQFRDPAIHHSMVTSLLSSISEFPLSDEKQLPAAREMVRLNWLLNAARQLNAGGAIEGNYVKSIRLLQAAIGQDRHFVMAHARLAEAWYDMDFQGSAQQELLIALPERSRLHMTFGLGTLTKYRP